VFLDEREHVGDDRAGVRRGFESFPRFTQQFLASNAAVSRSTDASARASETARRMWLPSLR
jgi:hypothetical protein